MKEDVRIAVTLRDKKKLNDNAGTLVLGEKIKDWNAAELKMVTPEHDLQSFKDKDEGLIDKATNKFLTLEGTTEDGSSPSFTSTGDAIKLDKPDHTSLDIIKRKGERFTQDDLKSYAELVEKNKDKIKPYAMHTNVDGDRWKNIPFLTDEVVYTKDPVHLTDKELAELEEMELEEKEEPENPKIIHRLTIEYIVDNVVDSVSHFDIPDGTLISDDFNGFNISYLGYERITKITPFTMQYSRTLSIEFKNKFNLDNVNIDTNDLFFNVTLNYKILENSYKKASVYKHKNNYTDSDYDLNGIIPARTGTLRINGVRKGTQILSSAIQVHPSLVVDQGPSFPVTVDRDLVLNIVFRYDGDAIKLKPDELIDYNRGIVRFNLDGGTNSNEPYNIIKDPNYVIPPIEFETFQEIYVRINRSPVEEAEVNEIYLKYRIEFDPGTELPAVSIQQMIDWVKAHNANYKLENDKYRITCVLVIPEYWSNKGYQLANFDTHVWKYKYGYRQHANDPFKTGESTIKLPVAKDDGSLSYYRHADGLSDEINNLYYVNVTDIWVPNKMGTYTKDNVTEFFMLDPNYPAEIDAAIEANKMFNVTFNITVEAYNYKKAQYYKPDNDYTEADYNIDLNVPEFTTTIIHNVRNGTVLYDNALPYDTIHYTAIGKPEFPLTVTGNAEYTIKLRRLGVPLRLLANQTLDVDYNKLVPKDGTAAADPFTVNTDRTTNGEIKPYDGLATIDIIYGMDNTGAEIKKSFRVSYYTDKSIDWDIEDLASMTTDNENGIGYNVTFTNRVEFESNIANIVGFTGDLRGDLPDYINYYINGNRSYLESQGNRFYLKTEHADKKFPVDTPMVFTGKSGHSTFILLHDDRLTVAKDATTSVTFILGYKEDGSPVTASVDLKFYRWDNDVTLPISRILDTTDNLNDLRRKVEITRTSMPAEADYRAMVGYTIPEGVITSYLSSDVAKILPNAETNIEFIENKAYMKEGATGDILATGLTLVPGSFNYVMVHRDNLRIPDPVSMESMTVEFICGYYEGEDQSLREFAYTANLQWNALDPNKPTSVSLRDIMQFHNRPDGPIILTYMDHERFRMAKFGDLIGYNHIDNSDNLDSIWRDEYGEAIEYNQEHFILKDGKIYKKNGVNTTNLLNSNINLEAGEVKYILMLHKDRLTEPVEPPAPIVNKYHTFNINYGFNTKSDGATDKILVSFRVNWTEDDYADKQEFKDTTLDNLIDNFDKLPFISHIAKPRRFTEDTLYLGPFNSMTPAKYDSNTNTHKYRRDDTTIHIDGVSDLFYKTLKLSTGETISHRYYKVTRSGVSTNDVSSLKLSDKTQLNLVDKGTTDIYIIHNSLNSREKPAIPNEVVKNVEIEILLGKHETGEDAIFEFKYQFSSKYNGEYSFKDLINGSFSNSLVKDVTEDLPGEAVVGFSEEFDVPTDLFKEVKWLVSDTRYIREYETEKLIYGKDLNNFAGKKTLNDKVILSEGTFVAERNTTRFVFTAIHRDRESYTPTVTPSYNVVVRFVPESDRYRYNVINYDDSVTNDGAYVNTPAITVINGTYTRGSVISINDFILDQNVSLVRPGVLPITVTDNVNLDIPVRFNITEDYRNVHITKKIIFNDKWVVSSANRNELTTVFSIVPNPDAPPKPAEPADNLPGPPPEYYDSTHRVRVVFNALGWPTLDDFRTGHYSKQVLIDHVFDLKFNQRDMLSHGFDPMRLIIGHDSNIRELYDRKLPTYNSDWMTSLDGSDKHILTKISVVSEPDKFLTRHTSLFPNTFHQLSDNLDAKNITVNKYGLIGYFFEACRRENIYHSGTLNAFYDLNFSVLPLIENDTESYPVDDLFLFYNIDRDLNDASMENTLLVKPMATIQSIDSNIVRKSNDSENVRKVRNLNMSNNGYTVLLVSVTSNRLELDDEHVLDTGDGRRLRTKMRDNLSTKGSSNVFRSRRSVPDTNDLVYRDHNYVFTRINYKFNGTVIDSEDLITFNNTSINLNIPTGYVLASSPTITLGSKDNEVLLQKINVKNTFLFIDQDTDEIIKKETHTALVGTIINIKDVFKLPKGYTLVNNDPVIINSVTTKRILINKNVFPAMTIDRSTVLHTINVKYKLENGTEISNEIIRIRGKRKPILTIPEGYRAKDSKYLNSWNPNRPEYDIIIEPKTYRLNIEIRDDRNNRIITTTSRDIKYNQLFDKAWVNNIVPGFKFNENGFPTEPFTSSANLIVYGVLEEYWSTYVPFDERITGERKEDINSPTFTFKKEELGKHVRYKAKEVTILKHVDQLNRTVDNLTKIHNTKSLQDIEDLILELRSMSSKDLPTIISKVDKKEVRDKVNSIMKNDQFFNFMLETHQFNQIDLFKLEAYKFKGISDLHVEELLNNLYSFNNKLYEYTHKFPFGYFLTNSPKETTTQVMYNDILHYTDLPETTTLVKFDLDKYNELITKLKTYINTVISLKSNTVEGYTSPNLKFNEDLIAIAHGRILRDIQIEANDGATYKIPEYLGFNAFGRLSANLLNLKIALLNPDIFPLIINRFYFRKQDIPRDTGLERTDEDVYLYDDHGYIEWEVATNILRLVQDIYNTASEIIKPVGNIRNNNLLVSKEIVVKNYDKSIMSSMLNMFINHMDITVDTIISEERRNHIVVSKAENGLEKTWNRLKEDLPVHLQTLNELNAQYPTRLYIEKLHLPWFKIITLLYRITTMRVDLREFDHFNNTNIMLEGLVKDEIKSYQRLFKDINTLVSLLKRYWEGRGKYEFYKNILESLVTNPVYPEDIQALNGFNPADEIAVINRGADFKINMKLDKLAKNYMISKLQWLYSNEIGFIESIKYYYFIYNKDFYIGNREYDLVKNDLVVIGDNPLNDSEVDWYIDPEVDESNNERYLTLGQRIKTLFKKATATNVSVLNKYVKLINKFYSSADDELNNGWHHIYLEYINNDDRILRLFGSVIDINVKMQNYNSLFRNIFNNKLHNQFTQGQIYPGIKDFVNIQLGYKNNKIKEPKIEAILVAVEGYTLHVARVECTKHGVPLKVFCTVYGYRGYDTRPVFIAPLNSNYSLSVRTGIHFNIISLHGLVSSVEVPDYEVKNKHYTDYEFDTVYRGDVYDNKSGAVEPVIIWGNNEQRSNQYSRVAHITPEDLDRISGLAHTFTPYMNRLVNVYSRIDTVGEVDLDSNIPELTNINITYKFPTRPFKRPNYKDITNVTEKETYWNTDYKESIFVKLEASDIRDTQHIKISLETKGERVDTELASLKTTWEDNRVLLNGIELEFQPTFMRNNDLRVSAVLQTRNGFNIPDSPVIIKDLLIDRTKPGEIDRKQLKRKNTEILIKPLNKNDNFWEEGSDYYLEVIENSTIKKVAIGKITNEDIVQGYIRVPFRTPLLGDIVTVFTIQEPNKYRSFAQISKFTQLEVLPEEYFEIKDIKARTTYNYMTRPILDKLVSFDSTRNGINTIKARDLPILLPPTVQIEAVTKAPVVRLEISPSNNPEIKMVTEITNTRNQFVFNPVKPIFKLFDSTNTEKLYSWIKLVGDVKKHANLSVMPTSVADLLVILQGVEYNVTVHACDFDGISLNEKTFKRILAKPTNNNTFSVDNWVKADPDNDTLVDKVKLTDGNMIVFIIADQDNPTINNVKIFEIMNKDGAYLKNTTSDNIKINPDNALFMLDDSIELIEFNEYIKYIHFKNTIDDPAVYSNEMELNFYRDRRKSPFIAEIDLLPEIPDDDDNDIIVNVSVNLKNIVRPGIKLVNQLFYVENGKEYKIDSTERILNVKDTNAIFKYPLDYEYDTDNMVFRTKSHLVKNWLKTESKDEDDVIELIENSDRPTITYEEIFNRTEKPFFKKNKQDIMMISNKKIRLIKDKFNPYPTGTNYYIGLYDKDHKVIKTLTGEITNDVNSRVISLGDDITYTDVITFEIVVVEPDKLPSMLYVTSAYLTNDKGDDEDDSVGSNSINNGDTSDNTDTSSNNGDAVSTDNTDSSISDNTNDADRTNTNVDNSSDSDNNSGDDSSGDEEPIAPPSGPISVEDSGVLTDPLRRRSINYLTIYGDAYYTLSYTDEIRLSDTITAEQIEDHVISDRADGLGKLYDINTAYDSLPRELYLVPKNITKEYLHKIIKTLKFHIKDLVITWKLPAGRYDVFLSNLVEVDYMYKDPTQISPYASVSFNTQNLTDDIKKNIPLFKGNDLSEFDVHDYIEGIVLKHSDLKVKYNTKLITYDLDSPEFELMIKSNIIPLVTSDTFNDRYKPYIININTNYTYNGNISMNDRQRVIVDKTINSFSLFYLVEKSSGIVFEYRELTQGTPYKKGDLFVLKSKRLEYLQKVTNKLELGYIYSLIPKFIKSKALIIINKKYTDPIVAAVLQDILLNGNIGYKSIHTDKQLEVVCDNKVITGMTLYDILDHVTEYKFAYRDDKYLHMTKPISFKVLPSKNETESSVYTIKYILKDNPIHTVESDHIWSEQEILEAWQQFNNDNTTIYKQGILQQFYNDYTNTQYIYAEEILTESKLTIDFKSTLFNPIVRRFKITKFSGQTITEKEIQHLFESMELDKVFTFGMPKGFINSYNFDQDAHLQISMYQKPNTVTTILPDKYNVVSVTVEIDGTTYNRKYYFKENDRVAISEFYNDIVLPINRRNYTEITARPIFYKPHRMSKDYNEVILVDANIDINLQVTPITLTSRKNINWNHPDIKDMRNILFGETEPEVIENNITYDIAIREVNNLLAAINSITSYDIENDTFVSSIDDNTVIEINPGSALYNAIVGPNNTANIYISESMRQIMSRLSKLDDETLRSISPRLERIRRIVLEENENAQPVLGLQDLMLSNTPDIVLEGISESTLSINLPPFYDILLAYNNEPGDYLQVYRVEKRFIEDKHITITLPRSLENNDKLTVVFFRDNYTPVNPLVITKNKNNYTYTYKGNDHIFNPTTSTSNEHVDIYLRGLLKVNTDPDIPRQKGIRDSGLWIKQTSIAYDEDDRAGSFYVTENTIIERYYPTYFNLPENAKTNTIALAQWDGSVVYARSSKDECIILKDGSEFYPMNTQDIYNLAVVTDSGTYHLY